MMRTLVLGSGPVSDPAPDCYYVDKLCLPGVQLVMDLNDVPWPLESGEFEAAVASDIIEHLDDVVATMEEIWRVLIPGGRVAIRTAYWRCENAFTDPTHKHYFTQRSFDFFCPGTELFEGYGWYSTARFKMIERSLQGEELYVILEKMG